MFELAVLVQNMQIVVLDKFHYYSLFGSLVRCFLVVKTLTFHHFVNDGAHDDDDVHDDDRDAHGDHDDGRDAHDGGDRDDGHDGDHGDDHDVHGDHDDGHDDHGDDALLLLALERAFLMHTGQQQSKKP
ncbi:hypothetical protein CDAR_460611 [Caerostris darwini]|uniref:Uncharacterized protein n=1 Tax=Caerostris darwini TaxID=1538125 RepID=A0AAV4PS15_9ARAC|nr:hypothetical protein CDAR_460611 [Caerostris darwini]